MRKLLVLLVMAVLAGGCATWVRTGGPYVAQEQHLSLELPDGWMRWNQNAKDLLFVTRDGAALQSIVVENVHVGDQLKHTKKTLRNGMLPLEAAEVVLDNTASNPKVHGLEIKENRSVKIDGRPGFRAVYSFTNDDGLRMKAVVYGFMQGEWFYGLKYLAAQRHYFDRDLKSFEKVVASVRLLRL